MGIVTSKIALKGKKMVYRCKPDIPDYRDYMKNYQVHHSIRSGRTKIVDLRNHCPSIYTQGKLGSCTANAICGNYSYMYMKENDLEQKDELFFSRLFVYYFERDIEQKVKTDSGASIRDGMKVISKMGIPEEKYWEYDINKFSDKPSQESLIKALNHIVILYKRLDKDLNQMKQCLMDGDAFVFGFLVYESFESDDVAETGVMTVPKNGEKLLGRHAVMAVGFNDYKQCFIVRNSWGTEWGDDGYFYMPYEFMFGAPEHDAEIPAFTSDYWTIEVTKDK